MSLRAKLVAVLSAVLVGAIATTGFVLMRETRRYSGDQVLAQQQVYVEWRAQALGDDLRLLTEELRRLSRRAEVDLGDGDMHPEAQLLSAAHENSVLYNIGLRVVAADGHELLAEPARPAGGPGELVPSLERLRGARGPILRVFEREGEAVLAVGVPIRRGGAFSGAIVGEVALARQSLFSHVLQPGKGEPSADVALVDSRGQVLFAAKPRRVAGNDWRTIAAEATGSRRAGAVRSGPRTASDAVYAYAPVGVAQLTLVYRWPFGVLDAAHGALLRLLWLILGAGSAVALVLGVSLAAYLTRPLARLGALAREGAAGRFPELRPERRRDEIGDLQRAFAALGAGLRERDARIQQDLAEIRAIADERERLYREVEALAASLDRRVAERTTELEAAQERLVESERFAAMGRAAAAMAHELKNSLGGISMGVDLVLQQSQGGSERVRRQVQEEIVRLREVTNSLLDFARTPRLALEERDLHRLVRRAGELLSETLAEQGAELHLELGADGAPLPLRCDGLKLEGVLINLLKNAAEAVGRAGRPGHVWVRTRRDGDRVVVEVDDDGAGITDEAQGHLFEPFWSSKPSGTGLGLATARRLVAAHGGAIAAAARPGGGARLTVTLPIRAEAA